MVLFTFKKSNELNDFAIDKKITGRDFKVQAGIGVKTSETGNVVLAPNG